MIWRVEAITGNLQTLEDLLNALSADGWTIHEIGAGASRVIAFKLRT